MDCRELEDRLRPLLDGELAVAERLRCERHLERCDHCRELVEPFDLGRETGPAPPVELVGDVLASTSGSPCGRSHDLLAAWLEDELSGGDRELMAAHLDGCADCRALAAVMTRLTAQLPRLAELRPDPGFTTGVLARTLPPAVRLRRWWTAVWPRWLLRPRFASEAAFIATIVLALVFATPGSPLAAVPGRALVLARSDPGERLEAPIAALEARLAVHVRAPLEAGVRSSWEVAAAHGEAVAAALESWLGTWREIAASLLGRADTEASDGKDATSDPTRERP